MRAATDSTFRTILACSRAARKKPSDSRNLHSTPQAWHPEDFQKQGNTVSVSYNLLPTFNSKYKANRSYIITPFSCKANPAPTALLYHLSLSWQAVTLPPRAHETSSLADSLQQDTTYKQFPAKRPRSLQKEPVSLLTLNCWAFSPLNPAGTGTAGGTN